MSINVRKPSTANIVSVFSSLQGEGILVGKPQIFVRFAGCNLRCKYCDTSEGLTPQPHARIETPPFSQNFKTVRNPLESRYLAEEVLNLSRLAPVFHSLSLTGGEPLLQTDFLMSFLPRVRKSRHFVSGIFLETNGTLPERLKEVIDLIDIISMDIKIPSTAGSETNWEATYDFLNAGSKKDIYVKIVISNDFRAEELKQAKEIISRVNPDIPLVLQPVSNHTRHKDFISLSPPRLLEAYKIFKPGLKDVRIIPQVHKLMGWL